MNDRIDMTMNEISTRPLDRSSRAAPARTPVDLAPTLPHGTDIPKRTIADRSKDDRDRSDAAARDSMRGACAALAVVRPLWDRSGAGWFVYAADGRLVYANPAVEQIVGAKVSIGSTALVPPVVPESAPSYQRVMKRLRCEPTTGTIVITLLVPDGEECRLVSASLVAVPEPGSSAHAVIGTLQRMPAKFDKGPDPALERLSRLERVIARIVSDLDGVAAIHDERLPMVDGLSLRQREILQRIMAGERPEVIALGLSLSVHTVRNHTKAIFRVLGVHSRSELLVRMHAHT